MDDQLGYGDVLAIAGTGGTVTDVPTVGASIEWGDTAFAVDAGPVVAMYGTTPTYRNLVEGDSGADVWQLEANLVALGYDPDNTVTIDEDFTSYTEVMVERWREELGVEVTGEVLLGDIVVIAGPSTVRATAQLGAAASGVVLTLAARSAMVDLVEDGTLIDQVSSDVLSAELVVDVADADEFSVGDVVDVEQLDGAVLAGTVSEVGTEAVAANDGTSTMTVSVSISGTSTVSSPELIEGAVLIRTVGTEVLDALVVPSRALVSSKEGGFAVEKVDTSGTTSLVGIEIGTFDDGVVEVVSVTQGTLVEGDELVVPQWARLSN